MTHAIRLRDPWDAAPQANGTVRFTRHFNRPTGLDDGTRVWLVIEGGFAPAAVTLNGDLVGQASGPPCIRYEITALLRPRNKLEIDLPPLPAAEAPTLGQVRLEIE